MKIITDNEVNRQKLFKMIDSGEVYEVEIVKRDRKRTLSQNAALHKYCELVATALNDAGLDIGLTLQEQMAVSWTMKTVKEVMWHAIQTALGYEASTAKLETDQVTRVYEILNRHLADKFGMPHIPFPSIDSLRMKSYE